MNKLYLFLSAITAIILLAQGAVAKPPSWDTKINGAGRFKVLSQFNNEAVLDKETGLVWEESPDTTARTWLGALSHCNAVTVGNRKGWRLPTVQELATLVDPSVSPGPTLPSGHPFNAQSSTYWSATTDAADSNDAWSVRFATGIVEDAGKSNSLFVWCVRGGQGVDPQ